MNRKSKQLPAGRLFVAEASLMFMQKYNLMLFAPYLKMGWLLKVVASSGKHRQDGCHRQYRYRQHQMMFLCVLKNIRLAFVTIAPF
jgi:hypothetical protein